MAFRYGWAIAAAVAGLIWQGPVLADPPPGHITGIGGVFLKSSNPQALAAWYRDVLGLNIEKWGGAALPSDAPGHPPKVAWAVFPDATDYMAPSKRDYMIDYAVDDMDAMIARLTAKGVPILGREDKDPSGRFAWVLDPDGTKVELWQPAKPAAP